MAIFCSKPPVAFLLLIASANVLTMASKALENGLSITFYIVLPVEYNVNHRKVTSAILNFLVVTF